MSPSPELFARAVGGAALRVLAVETATGGDGAAAAAVVGAAAAAEPNGKACRCAVVAELPDATSLLALAASAAGCDAPRVLTVEEAVEVATDGDGTAAAVVGAVTVAEGGTCETGAVLPGDRNDAMSSPQSRL